MPIAIASPPRLIRLADMPTARMTISAITIAKRQAEGDHQRGPPVAEKQQQQHDDENGGFAQRADDGADGTADQPAAIVEHVDGDALRQRGLQLLQALADVAHELAGIGAAQAEHQPLDRFAVAVDA